MAFFDFFYEEGIFWFTKIQIAATQLILNTIGYSTEVYGKTLKIVGSMGILVDRGCLGRNLLGLYAGFILAIPGKTISKLWFVPLGFFTFIILNILRILGLVITEYCCPENLDFNHHFAFKIVVYFAIFILWSVWIRKYSFFAKKYRK